MFLHKNKDKTYAIRYKALNGKYTTKRLKTTSKIQAYKLLQDFILTYKKGTIVKDTISIGSLLSNYITDSNKYIVNRFYKLYSCDIPANLLLPIHFENYRDERLKDGLSPSSVNDELIFFKACYNKGIKLKLLSDNPLKGIKFLPIPIKRERQIFNASEIQLLINIDDIPLRNVVIFGFYTGCRISEILNLEWTDYKNGVIIIGNKMKNNEYSFLTKNRYDRTIHVSAELSDFLNGIEHTSTYVFVDKNNKKFNKNHVSKLFKKHIRLLGIQDNLHFHSIRKTVITNLVKKHSVYNVQQFIGHKTFSQTLSYVDKMDDELKVVADSISLKK